TGSHFAAGSTVVFSKDGDPGDGIDEGAATVDTNGTKITLSIAIDAAAPEGPHDLRVEAPDGSFCTEGSAFVVMKSGGGGQARVIACNDASISRKGGWHEVADARSSFGQYCRNVGANKGNAPAY